MSQPRTMQKACRMVNQSLDGLDGEESKLVSEEIDLDLQLKTPTDTRLFAVQVAFERGYTVDKVWSLTKIDKWFLSKLKMISDQKKAAKEFKYKGGVSKLAKNPDALRVLKLNGFSDRQVSEASNTNDFRQIAKVFLSDRKEGNQPI